MTRLVILFIALVFLSCKDNINDTDKRNENWCWWIDSKTGIGKWIPLADETTVENGIYTTFYYNGSVRDIGRLKNRKDVDTMKSHDLSGKLISYKIFLKDTAVYYYLYNGLYKYYYANGNILSKGIVSNHTRGNYWTKYYDNGNIEFTEKYVGDSGTTIWYYKSGIMMDSCSFKDHKMNGVFKIYYPNRTLKLIANYSLGKRNGEYLYYYENGILKQRRNFKLDLRDGVAKKYYENGNLKLEHVYENDTLNGQETFFYENGNIEKTGLIIKGKAQGEWKEYTEQGKLSKIGFFKDDICERVKNYP